MTVSGRLFDLSSRFSVRSNGRVTTAIDSSTKALVIGAPGGLGSNIVAELASRGAAIAMVSKNGEKLAAVTAAGPKLALDLRDPSACKQAIDFAVAELGGLDLVINAMGVVAFGPVDELSIDVLEELFLTNTFAPIMLTTAALGQLDAGSTIVNISGVIAEQNLPGMAAYGASKAALMSFDQAVAREARRAKVRVIDARPPHTETGLADRPIAGTAPKMPTGLDPAAVARVIVEGIESGATELPSSAFG